MHKSLRVAVAACTLVAGAYSQAFAADTLRIGTEPTFAPFEFTDSSNKIVGYDVDIVKALGKEAGFEVEIVSMPFDGLIPALMTSQLDAVAAGMTITEERAKKVDFTVPYYNSGLSAVVLKNNADKYKKLSDLSKSRICGQIGNTGVEFAKKLSGNVAAFNTHSEAFMELKSKGCEAVITDRPVNEYFLASQKDDTFAELNDFAESAQFGVAVKKGNSELLSKLNDAMQKIRDNGTFKEIHMKWFGTPE